MIRPDLACDVALPRRAEARTAGEPAAVSLVADQPPSVQFRQRHAADDPADPTNTWSRRNAAPGGEASGATSSGLPSSLLRGDPAVPSRMRFALTRRPPRCLRSSEESCSCRATRRLLRHQVGRGLLATHVDCPDVRVAEPHEPETRSSGGALSHPRSGPVRCVVRRRAPCLSRVIGKGDVAVRGLSGPAEAGPS